MTDTMQDSNETPAVVLASQSRTRAMLLENAGVKVETAPAHVDEDTVKESLKAEGASAMEVAVMLAELKANRVSSSRPGALVIGADQTLDCNGIWFDKPADRDHLRGHLTALSGKRHQLNSAVCVSLNGSRIWSEADSAELTMRPLSEDFIDWYMENAGDHVLGSVGGYQLEGLGAQLFTSVKGDFFTVLGLPLLPLLSFLRNYKVVPE